jgi:hypothetical protein
VKRLMVRYTVKPERAAETVRERCEDAPVVSELHEIGSYRLVGE